VSVRDSRMPPFSWQSREAMAVIAAHYRGSERDKPSCRPLQTARSIYVALTEAASSQHLGRDRESIAVSRAELADRAGCDVRTFDRYIADLAALGVVAIERRRIGGVNLPSLYTLPNGGGDAASTSGDPADATPGDPGDGRVATLAAPGVAILPTPLKKKPEEGEEGGGSPAVSGRASARAAAPASSRTVSPPGSVDATTELAEHVQGILQRGIDGLTSDAPAKAPTIRAVRGVLAKHNPPRDVAVAVAVEVRSIAQSQNRAPNICALFAQRLAALPQRPPVDQRAAAMRELGEKAATINAQAEAAG
jgi:hypothetical protein